MFSIELRFRKQGKGFKFFMGILTTQESGDRIQKTEEPQKREEVPDFA